MITYYTHYHCGVAGSPDKGGYLQIQRAEYIEDGWYIKVYDYHCEAWEIAQYGGNEECIAEDVSLDQAFEIIKTLT